MERDKRALFSRATQVVVEIGGRRCIFPGRPLAIAGRCLSNALRVGEILLGDDEEEGFNNRG